MSDEDQDVIGEDDHDHRGRARLGGDILAAPEAIALVSLLLAGFSMAGMGFMNGAIFVPSLYIGGPESSKALVAALVGVGLALLPLATGLYAIRRLAAQSPWRVLAAAAVLMAVAAVALRSVVAVLTLVDDSVPFPQY